MLHQLYLQARELYSCVCDLQPLASQGWLEWSKMEEECGQVQRSLQILRSGEGNYKMTQYCMELHYFCKLIKALTHRTGDTLRQRRSFIKGQLIKCTIFCLVMWRKYDLLCIKCLENLFLSWLFINYAALNGHYCVGRERNTKRKPNEKFPTKN